jgi:hypothetical protein
MMTYHPHTLAGLQVMKPRLTKRLHGDAKSTKGIKLNHADDNDQVVCKPKPCTKNIKECWAQQIESVLNGDAAEGTETAATVVAKLLKSEHITINTTER